ncbi:MAG: DUF4157 domain-containing protein [Fibrobacter sp.]|nr:DUF4157 domain-containing protein [Fibrobacter sp.]
MSTTYAQKQATTQKKDASSASSVLDASSQSETLQRKADMANNASQRAEAPRPNNTGMPDNLKAGIESLSGFSMDDVRVHYNSSKPATVQALAYTQGTDIHVAPGQEKHLPHEAWHVAQQMAGRVSPTTNINGMPVNDNAGLEHEADVMGEKAMMQRKALSGNNAPNNKRISCVAQMKYPGDEAPVTFYDENPTEHPEYELYKGLMHSLGFDDGIIDTTWELLVKGFSEQDFIQHQLEVMEIDPEINLEKDTKDLIRNDNPYFLQVAEIMRSSLTVPDNLALWSGGIDLSDYAFSRGYTPLEQTPFGKIINQIEFHRQWNLQAPLWNILSSVFASSQSMTVHVFLRTYEADAVLFRREIPQIKQLNPHVTIRWHAIYTDGADSRRFMEIDNNYNLQLEWDGFKNEYACVQALLQYLTVFYNENTDRGLETILNNLPDESLQNLPADFFTETEN